MPEMTHSQKSLKLKALPISLELAPCAIQAVAIAAFVLAAHPARMESLGAAIISLIWLRLSQSKLPDQYAELRERRQLFIQVGDWMGQKDASQAIDRIQAECITEDDNGEGLENVQAAVTAAGIVGIIRGLASLSLFAYLAVLLVRPLL